MNIVIRQKILNEYDNFTLEMYEVIILPTWMKCDCLSLESYAFSGFIP